MTPKEKAEELVLKFSIVGLQQRSEGIACALIAADEIIKQVNHSDVGYWKAVKLEIEKL